MLITETIKGTLKLQILLWYIAHRLQVANKKSEEFRKTIKDKKFVLQIGTHNAFCVRYFSVSDGRIFSETRKHDQPDLTIQFKTAEDGFELLAKGSQTSFMYALQEGKINMQGDPSILFWFSGIAHFLKPGHRQKH